MISDMIRRLNSTCSCRLVISPKDVAIIPVNESTPFTSWDISVGLVP